MSVPEADLPPVAFQEAMLSAGLNSTLVQTFLTGIYAVVYFGTLYIYLSRKTTTTSWMVVFTLTMIFVGVIGQLATQWHLIQWQFINNGESRESIFLTFFDHDSKTLFWSTVAASICVALTSIFADTLLIWRCFHIWNRSLRVILFSLILLTAEIGLQLYAIIVPCTKHQAISDREGIILNKINSAAYFVTAGCTLVTTCLIAYRIYPIFGHDSLLVQSRGRFHRILDILIQSAAAYALVSLLVAISYIMPTNANNPSQLVTILALEDYSSCLFNTIVGLAPTLIVTRIAMTSDKIETFNTPHLSVLRFQGRSTQQTTHNRMNNPSAPAVGEEGDVRRGTEKDEPEMRMDSESV